MNAQKRKAAILLAIISFFLRSSIDLLEIKDWYRLFAFPVIENIAKSNFAAFSKTSKNSFVCNKSKQLKTIMDRVVFLSTKPRQSRD